MDKNGQNRQKWTDRDKIGRNGQTGTTEMDETGQKN